MKKLHISIICFITIALLACTCTSNVFASEIEDVLTHQDVDFKTTPIINSTYNDAEKVFKELGPHDEEKLQYFSDGVTWESYDCFFCV